MNLTLLIIYELVIYSSDKLLKVCDALCTYKYNISHFINIYKNLKLIIHILDLHRLNI